MFNKPIGLRVAFTGALIAASTLAACSRAPETEPKEEPAAEVAQAPAADERKVASFQIGEAQAFALRDGGLSFPNDGKVLAINHTPEEVSELVTAAGLPGDELSLSIQPLLVKVADKVLLFDTGAGKNMGPSGGGLPEALAEAGVDPASVTDIFISHAHGDHVGGLIDAEGAARFPNAAIHISSPEWAYLKGMAPEKASNSGLSQHEALVAAMEPKVVGFAPGAEILPGLVKAVEIKGHTPGHSGYQITSGESSLLYFGDTMHHFVVSVQRPDWTIAFDGDAPTAEASRRELLARVAQSGQRLYAVHFPFPGVGKVEKQGDTFVWVAEEL